MVAPDQIDLIDVSLSDVRASLESMLRAVTVSQLALSQLRHTQTRTALESLSHAVESIHRDAAAVSETATEASITIDRLMNAAT